MGSRANLETELATLCHCSILTAIIHPQKQLGQSFCGDRSQAAKNQHNNAHNYIRVKKGVSTVCREYKTFTYNNTVRQQQHNALVMLSIENELIEQDFNTGVIGKFAQKKNILSLQVSVLLVSERFLVYLASMVCICNLITSGHYSNGHGLVKNSVLLN